MSRHPLARARQELASLDARLAHALPALVAGPLATALAGLLALGTPHPARAPLLSPATATACGWNRSVCAKGNPSGRSQADWWAAGPVRWGPSGGTSHYAIDLYGSRVGWLTGSGAIIPLGVGGQVADITDAGSGGAVNVAVFTSGWFTGRAGPP